MPRPRRISAKRITADIRAGLDDEGIREKYRLSEKGLLSLFEKLLKAGVITEEELRNRGGTPQPDAPSQEKVEKGRGSAPGTEEPGIFLSDHARECLSWEPEASGPLSRVVRKLNLSRPAVVQAPIPRVTTISDFSYRGLRPFFKAGGIEVHITEPRGLFRRMEFVLIVAGKPVDIYRMVKILTPWSVPADWLLIILCYSMWLSGGNSIEGDGPLHLKALQRCFRLNGDALRRIEAAVGRGMSMSALEEGKTDLERLEALAAQQESAWAESLSRRPWYDRVWLVALLVLILFPVGLYALWRNNFLSRRLKCLVTPAVLLIFAVFCLPL